MKTILLLVALLGLTACQNAKSARTTPGTGIAGTLTSTLPESRREEKRRALQNETEARVKTYERQGYTTSEARAIAEAEYFRSGK